MTTIAWDGCNLATDSRSSTYINKKKVSIDDSVNKLYIFEKPVKLEILGEDNAALAITGCGSSELCHKVAKEMLAGNDPFRVLAEYKKAEFPIQGHADWIIVTEKGAGHICTCSPVKFVLSEKEDKIAEGSLDAVAGFLMSRFGMSAPLAVANAASATEATSSLISYASFRWIDGKLQFMKKDTVYYSTNAEVIGSTYRLLEKAKAIYDEEQDNAKKAAEAANAPPEPPAPPVVEPVPAKPPKRASRKTQK